MLVDICEGMRKGYCLRSGLAMPRVYNVLLAYVVSAGTVSGFQSRLQHLLLHYAQSGCRGLAIFI